MSGLEVPKHKAYFDVVTLGELTPSSLIPIHRVTIHLVAYLASVSSIWSGEPSSAWGYDFSVDQEGFPLARELDVALAAAERRGVLVRADEDLLQVDKDRISIEKILYSQSSQYLDRHKHLHHAIISILALPSGIARSAVNNSAGVRTAIRHRNTTLLHREPHVVELVSHYQQLLEAVESHNAPSSMLSLWLSAMYNTVEAA